jgi:uncharacterized protein YacL
MRKESIGKSRLQILNKIYNEELTRTKIREEDIPNIDLLHHLPKSF